MGRDEWTVKRKEIWGEIEDTGEKFGEKERF